MAKLSKEKAEWHYDKLLALHYFEYLTLAQKVSIFYHDLEHDILKDVTGKKEYFEQFNWLKDNQIRIERNIKTGEIPKVNIGDIDNLKNWRNEGIHENKMPEPKYKSHLHTMAQTICFFSEIPIPEEISNLFENKTEKKLVETEKTIKKYGGELILLPDDETFKKNLLKTHKANWTILYEDGRKENGTWIADNFKESSDVIHNISSGYLRDWKNKKIVKAIFEVKI